MTAPRRPDVDELARRLPRREPSPERAAALRRALLDAAEAARPASTGATARRWVIGAGVAAAAAAAATLCVWLALRGSDPARGPALEAGLPAATRAPGPSRAADPANAAPAPGSTAAEARAASRGAGSSGAPAASADPAAPGDPVPDGITAIHATRPVQLARGGTRITAPPGARFEVDVQDDQVHRITVTSGWVVVAGAHTTATVVIERQTWIPEPPPASTTPTAGSPAPTPPRAAPPRAAAASGTSGSPAQAPRSPPASAPPAPGHIAAILDRTATALPPAAEPPAHAVDPEAQRRAAVEQDFRDGLRALLDGQARAATDPLDRACGVISSSQDDICYWAAAAWLRAGDRMHARRALADLLIRWPSSTHAGEASVALGWLLLEAGDRAAARARFAAAVNDPLPGVRADAARGLTAAR